MGEEKAKNVIFAGSGSVWDPEKGKRVAEFDKKRYCLKTSDKRVIELCKKAGFKQINEIPKEPEVKDELYDGPALTAPIQVDAGKGKK